VEIGNAVAIEITRYDATATATLPIEEFGRDQGIAT
jgi:hypothetical protein